MPEPTGLQFAAQRKRDAALTRATAALAELAEQGAPVSFQNVARRAHVSRQWLYGQPALRAQIEQLRERPAHGVPARERASDASLQQRVRGLLDDNQALREEVQALKHELALAYGQQRHVRGG
jgi:Family of unknown function (DUF6262)